MNNIYRIDDAKYLDSIIYGEKDKLCVILYHDNTYNASTYTKYAKDMPNIFFVMIDVDAFIDERNKFINKIKSVPTYHYYYNGNVIGNVSGPDVRSFVELLKTLVDATRLGSLSPNEPSGNSPTCREEVDKGVNEGGDCDIEKLYTLHNYLKNNTLKKLNLVIKELEKRDVKDFHLSIYNESH